MLTWQGGRDRVQDVLAPAPSIPPRKPRWDRPCQAEQAQRDRHLLLGNLEATGVCSAALKPADPSIPQHSEETQLSPGQSIEKSMPVLYISRKMQMPKIWQFCQENCLLLFFFNAAYNILLRAEHLSRNPEGF